jgi:hypothetical protein
VFSNYGGSFYHNINDIDYEVGSLSMLYTTFGGAHGTVTLSLGNEISRGTEGAMGGQIRLYDPYSQYYINLTADKASALEQNYTLILPNEHGILATREWANK